MKSKLMKKIYFLIAILFIGFSVLAQDFTINTSNSELKWTGKKVTGEHWGFIKLKDGSLTLKSDKTLSGVFNINMKSITCNDLEDPEWNGKLVGHLKSDDFFGVEKFALASLEIKESSPLMNNKADVKGNLTIKGKTHPIEFSVLRTDKGFNATIQVDRTLYDIRYGSGKFFDSLGDNMIYDQFELEVKLELN